MADENQTVSTEATPEQTNLLGEAPAQDTNQTVKKADDQKTSV